MSLKLKYNLQIWSQQRVNLFTAVMYDPGSLWQLCHLVVTDSTDSAKDSAKDSVFIIYL